jgi:hypothetical protein
MEFGSPIRQGTVAYCIPIQTTIFLKVQYPSNTSGSHTSPPLDLIEMKEYIAKMGVLYESYSVKWFDKKTPAFFFIQNTTHKWNYSNSEPYKSEARYLGTTIIVHQIWRPESIVIQNNIFQIQWVLETSEYGSYSVTGVPSGVQSEEIPYGENQIHFVLNETPRSMFHRKIRRAKIVAAIANLRVKKLYLKYYKRYGDFNENTGDSPLSSDSEI